MQQVRSRAKIIRETHGQQLDTLLLHGVPKKSMITIN
jgi:hypothetical protein